MAYVKKADKEEVVRKTQPEISKEKTGECPWCNYENEDERKGPLHLKEESKLIMQSNGRFQCETCGKHWAHSSLGKEWSEALERGPKWERETRGRELTGLR